MELAVFNTGRHINEIPLPVFKRIEEHGMAYPVPYLGHAWLAFLFWDKSQGAEQTDLLQPNLWFVKLPLDEQGQLSIHHRDRFLQHVLIAIGNNLENQEREQQISSVMDNNPYSFVAAPEQQAVVHSKARKRLGIPPSDKRDQVLSYLTNPTESWQELAIQGFADITIDWERHKTTLLSAIPKLPQEVVKTLAIVLENETIDGDVTSALIERLNNNLPADVQAALIRGLSSSQDITARQEYLHGQLRHTEKMDIEGVISIATRCYRDLTNPDLALAFLENLARQEHNAFDKVLGDLLLIGWMREPLLSVLNNSDISQALTAKSQLFFSRYTGAPQQTH